jgi:hypothetical protein
MLLDKPDQSGTTYRQHLQTVERQTGKRPSDLDGPEFPYAMSHLWSAFLDLSATRQSGMNGPMAITYNEIQCYCNLTGIDLTPLDVKIIKRLDAVYLRKSRD